MLAAISTALFLEDSMENVALELIKIIKSTQNFVVEQMPDVAQQLLIQGAYDAKVLIIVGRVLLGLAFLFFIYSLVATYKFNDDFYIGGILILALVSIPAVPCLLVGASDLHKIKHAPKVYLLESLSKIAQSK
jgi:hypothetical protein